MADADAEALISQPVTPAEPVSIQEETPPIPIEEIPSDSEDAEAVEGEGSISEPTPLAEDVEVPIEEPVNVENTSVLESMIVERQGKIEQRNNELEDMKSMLAILKDQNNDPERIELYVNLIAKTEKEINDLKNEINRYDNAKKE